MNPRGNHKYARHSDEGSGRPSEKGIKDFLLDASDLANFLTADRLAGFYCGTQKLLRSVLAEKPELSFSVVSLLWHKLIAAPEIQPTAESTSAQQGWRQVNLSTSISQLAYSFLGSSLLIQLSRSTSYTDHIFYISGC